ncbi:hypothetical protein PPGU19_075970 (plasmid) [Paraburkholderia sp. PGU19]|nr:hypothetical protein PPGU19_075970 [Paraburkholderia sp. PGU19]
MDSATTATALRAHDAASGGFMTYSLLRAHVRRALLQQAYISKAGAELCVIFSRPIRKPSRGGVHEKTWREQSRVEQETKGPDDLSAFLATGQCVQPQVAGSQLHIGSGTVITPS